MRLRYAYFAFRLVSTATRAALLRTPWNDILEALKWKIVSTVNPQSFRVHALTTLLVVLSIITGSVLWIRIKSIWKRLRSVFTTRQRPMDSPPSVASVSDGNTNLIAPSETVEETQHPARSDISEDEEPVLEVTADSSATVRLEVPSALLVTSPQIGPVDEESNSNSDTDSDEESFCFRYRRKRVCQSATQTEKKFKSICRASLFPKSPFPRSLRPAEWNHLSRFQSSGHTPVEIPLYHPPSQTLPALPLALRGSWIN